MANTNPSLLTRATRLVSTHLELTSSSSHAHLSAPPSPTHWSESTHRAHLIRLWDAIEERAAASPYAFTTGQRVASTQSSMIHAFPALALGERALSRDWIEYVLGVALRHPFCTAEKMGRWEILAASGGARGTWGPW